MSMTLYVLNNGDLFVALFNAIAAFMNDSIFTRLLSLSAAFGFFVAILAFFKSLNPTTVIKWFFMYMIVFNIVMMPKSTLVVYDMSQGNQRPVDNVPTIVAFTAELMTGLGTGLAEKFDMIFAMPDSLQYSKTGFLFGSKIIQEAREFKITNPELKANLDRFFRQCVVGDLYLNQVLSPTELKQSNNIWQAITKNPSVVRRVVLFQGKDKIDRSCKEAHPILKTALDEEIKNTYSLYGFKLFGNQKAGTYKTLLDTNLNNAFQYYQGINTNASETFLQSMMLNVIKEGIDNYPAYLQSSSSVINHQFAKSQVQQAYGWQIGGMKAAWFLPFFQSVLMFLLIAMFPLMIIFIIAFNGWESIKSYLTFFLSVQLWPVCFAILNLAMLFYGKSVSNNYGAMTLNSMDDITSSHATVASMAGYMMVFIPWLCHGLVSKMGIGEKFGHLATSMLSGIQNSTMAAASEAANASFSLGNTSFYNATGNNLSANKHDSNFTALHGNTTRQLASGATETTTLDGSRILDASGTISKSAFSINGQKMTQGALNHAAEVNTQAMTGESVQYGKAINAASNDIMQLSNLRGKDLKLGEGVSTNETSHLSQALSNIIGTAESVAEKTGVTTNQALTGLINAGVGGQVGLSLSKSAPGKLAQWFTGADGSVYAKTGYDISDSTSRQSNHGYDKVLDAKQMKDFKNDLNFASNFTKTHHVDTSTSQGGSLLDQTGHDLRNAQHLNNNIDASLSRGQRIAHAKSITESGGASINQNMDTLFQGYVSSRLGTNEANDLFGHPGSIEAQAKLSNLANDFIHDSNMQNKIIEQYGNQSGAVNPQKQFKQDSGLLNEMKQGLIQEHNTKKNLLQHLAEDKGLGVENKEVLALKNKVNKQLEQAKIKTEIGHDEVKYQSDIQKMRADAGIKQGQQDSKATGQMKKLLPTKGDKL